MAARVMQGVVLAVLSVVVLTGCGRQVSQESPPDLSLLATGPDHQAVPAPSPRVAAALDASGGLAAWEQCRKIEFHAAVTECERGGCYYLTEHDFVLFPWSDAIQVAAREPQTTLTWQLIRGQYYAPQADPNVDVSPLKGLWCDYADAILQIVTAPVRMLDDQVMLSPASAAAQITGQWYLPIDAKYASVPTVSQEKTVCTPRWTKAIYFQSQDRSLVDMVWLGDPAAGRFLVVRGYDYTRNADGVLIPTKIEIFPSDAEANLGPRLALLDVSR